MKILHTVEFYEPSKGGAQEVVKQISERMVMAGHDVTVATTKLPQRKKSVINGVKIVEFDISGNTVVGMHGEASKYKKFLVSSGFDVMMNYAAQQWATDLVYDQLDKIDAAKVIVPCGYSALHNPDFKDYFEKLPAYLRKYDASVYMSKQHQDIKYAQENHLKNLRVIPNGADEKEFDNPQDVTNFRRRHKINKKFMMIAIGNHTGAKGHKEMLEVFEQLPFPASLVIVGEQTEGGCYEECEARATIINQKFRLKHRKKVCLLKLNRADTVAALKSADLFFFPSNIEASPIVLFEAAAAGLPFVASDAGNSREIASLTGGGVITKTLPADMNTGNVTIDIASAVNLVSSLYKSPQKRLELGSKGRLAWQKDFTWAKITEQYLKLYEEIRK